MKMPLTCPFCQGPLASSFEAIWEVQHKVCNKKVDHNIEFIAHKDNNDIVNNIGIWINLSYSAWWDLGKESLKIRRKPSPYRHPLKARTNLILPFFEPDLTNYSKLLTKIRTYLIFS